MKSNEHMVHGQQKVRYQETKKIKKGAAPLHVIHQHWLRLQAINRQTHEITDKTYWKWDTNQVRQWHGTQNKRWISLSLSHCLSLCRDSTWMVPQPFSYPPPYPLLHHSVAFDSRGSIFNKLRMKSWSFSRLCIAGDWPMEWNHVRTFSEQN